jgi:hypothetical protein
LDREVKQAKGLKIIKVITYLVLKGGRGEKMSYVRNIATPHLSDIKKKWIEEISYYNDLR